MAADDRTPCVEWSDAEREAVREAAWRFPSDGTPEERRDAVLDALAPFVAERERQAAARALREAADDIHDRPWEKGEARRGPSGKEGQLEWLRGASDGVEWSCDRLAEQADRVEAGEEP